MPDIWHIVSQLILEKNESKYLISDFTDEWIEAQRDEVTSSRAQS